MNNLLRLSETSFEPDDASTSTVQDTHHPFGHKDGDSEDEGSQVGSGGKYYITDVTGRTSNIRHSIGSSGSSGVDGAHLVDSSTSGALEEERDALDDDEFYDEFERETTVSRGSDEEELREGSIIDASLDVISRLSMRLSSALGAPSGANGRASFRLSMLGRGKGDEDVASAIAMSNIRSTSPGTSNEAASVINALHGMMDTDVTAEHEHDEV
jgi:hypothetical protein